MNISEDRIRDLAIQAVNELGENASAEAVREYIDKKIQNVDAEDVLSEKSTGGRVILTSFGLNRPGVVAAITKILAERKCDLQDISQKLMQDFYTLIMMVDISDASVNFKDLQDELAKLAESMNIKVFLQHEDVFTFMHRI